MKVILSILSCVLGYSLNAQFVNIPDTFFRQKVFNQGIDTNNDYKISFEEAAAVTSLDLNSAFNNYFEKINIIEDLTGIEAFINISYLTCAENNVDSVDFSQNVKLTTLIFENPKIKYIDLSTNDLLEELSLNYCKSLTTLTIPTFQKIRKLSLIAAFLLNDLNFSSIKNVEILDISGTPFTQLDLSQNVKIKNLTCNNYQGTEIDISPLKELEGFYAFSSRNLIILDISDNQKLSTLDLGQTLIKNLKIGHNDSLKHISFRNAIIDSINLTKATNLRSLNFQSGVFNYLNLIGLSKLEAMYGNYCTVKTIDISEASSLKSVSIAHSNVEEVILKNNYSLLVFYSSNSSLRKVNFEEAPNLSILTAKNCAFDTLILNNPKLQQVDIQNSGHLSLVDISICQEILYLNLQGIFQEVTICQPYSPFPPTNSNIVEYSSGHTINFQSCTTGLEEKQLFKFSIYPNPASEKLIIEVDQTSFGESLISIFNMSGERVLIKQPTQSKKINIPLKNLDTGLYLLKVQNNNNTYIRKLIIE